MQGQTNSFNERVLTRADVLRLTGKSYVTLWRWMQAGAFPAPIRLGPNSVGWIEGEVQAWLEERKQDRVVYGSPSPARSKHGYLTREAEAPTEVEK